MTGKVLKIMSRPERVVSEHRNKIIFATPKQKHQQAYCSLYFVCQVSLKFLQ